MSKKKSNKSNQAKAKKTAEPRDTIVDDVEEENDFSAEDELSEDDLEEDELSEDDLDEDDSDEDESLAASEAYEEDDFQRANKPIKLDLPDIERDAG
ncbi:hypothetical protein KAI87_00685, partial [Myxococcota bacterium]|nr:hypothetical protein [Myxococcota bacterium]